MELRLPRSALLVCAPLVGALVAVLLVTGAARGGVFSCDKSWAVETSPGSGVGASGDWNVDGNWSPSGVPTDTQFVCLLPGTYTVTVKGAAAYGGLRMGNQSGTQTIAITGTNSGSDLPASLSGGDSGTTVGPNSQILLKSDGGSAGADLCAKNLSNSGVIQTAAGAGAGALTLRGQIDNLAGGQLNINADASSPTATSCGTNSLANDGGSVNIAGTATLTSQATFSQTAGITAVGTGQLSGSGAFSIAGGSFTGNAPVLSNMSAATFSGGTGTFRLHGTNQLTQSDIASGITLIDEATATDGNAVLVGPSSDWTNNGTIQLTSTTSDSSKQSELDSASTLGPKVTNNGSIQTLAGSGAQRVIAGAVTNANAGHIGIGTDASGELTLTNHGTLAIAPTATLFILGYAQGAAGALDVDIAGPTAGSGYSQLKVSGSATLGGTLHTNTTGAQVGSFKVVDAGSLATGTRFSSVTHTGEVYSAAYDEAAGDVTLTPAPFSLKVARRGNGSGRVTSTPAGINCPFFCSHTFTSPTRVTLRAKPAAGSRFSGWSGGAGCGGTGSCSVEMNSTHSLVATFRKIPTKPGIFEQTTLTASKKGVVKVPVFNPNAIPVKANLTLTFKRRKKNKEIVVSVSSFSFGPAQHRIVKVHLPDKLVKRLKKDGTLMSIGKLIVSAGGKSLGTPATLTIFAPN